MNMATVKILELKKIMHTHKQKVRTKENREARGHVDNNHISLKKQQIAKIGLYPLTLLHSIIMNLSSAFSYSHLYLSFL